LPPEDYRRLVDWLRTREQTRCDEQIDQFKNSQADLYDLWRRDPRHPSQHFRRLQGQRA
jgi:hypothetical protein